MSQQRQNSYSHYFGSSNPRLSGRDFLGIVNRVLSKGIVGKTGYTTLLPITEYFSKGI